MNTLIKILTLKSFWVGVGFIGFAVYNFTQGKYDEGVNALLMSGAVGALRHAIWKNNETIKESEK